MLIKTGINTMLAQYDGIYKVFNNYTAAFDAANAALDHAGQIYREECANIESITQEALADNAQKEKQLNAYINIAQAHSRQLIRATEPLIFDGGKLARIAVQINNSSTYDIFATQLYTEATGQLTFINQETVRISKEAIEKKQSLSSKYELKRSDINRKINSILNEITQYLYSSDFTGFLNSLRNDKLTYCSNINGTFAGKNFYSVSMGMVQLRLPIPAALKTKLVEITKGLYNSLTETIGIPLNIDLSKGAVIIAEYSNNSEHIILSGIQNLLLNIARYMNDDFNQIAFFDPIRFNNSSLGGLSSLAMGKNSFIDEVPGSYDEIRKKIKGILSSISEEERRRSEAAIKPTKRLYIFHNFPHAYDSALVSQIQQLCVNVLHYGITVILTNTISSNSTVSADVVAFLKTKAINIKADANSFSLRNDNDVKSPFEWYQAPQTLPKDVLKHVITSKPITNTSNIYENRIDIVRAPDYRKGVRQITNIPYGIDTDGNLHTLDFENSNFATFICGAARSGKSTLLHTIITGIVKDNHPDDVEIWLIDFKMTEFSRYIDHLPPHVRYIILDESPELVYDIIDRLSEILMKRQNLFKGKWTKLSEVPSDKYMPVIFIIIDEFSVMSQIIADSLAAGKDNYSIKLQTLLAKGAALGLRFIFASQGFTSGTRGLNDFSKKQVQQRIAMKTEYSEIKATLDLVSTSDDDKAMMEQLPVHHALLRTPVDERGNHLLYTEVLHISDYIIQENFIDTIRSRVTAYPRYEASNNTAYIDKKPMIIDGNNYFPFSAKSEEIQKYYSEHLSILEDRDEYVLFIGEPRRMLPLYPVELTNSFCENIMLVAPTTERMATSSVVMSIIESLRMQDVDVELWSTKKHPIYRQVVLESKTSALVYNELDEICRQIQEVKNAIQCKAEDSKFFVLLGFESFIIDMSYQQAASSLQPAFKQSSDTKKNDTLYEKRGADEPDLLTLLSALETGNLNDKVKSRINAIPPTPPNNSASVREEQTYTNVSDYAYDAREDLKFILTHGPKLGYHFIMAFNTALDINQSKLDVSLFKHKILFRLPKADAATLIGSSGSGVIAELEDRSFRYTNGLEGISFRPYLHPGLSWDGWQISGDNAVNLVDEEDEYLL